ncbi:MAG: 16S rRNA (guanine(966)-N(2))-methyltransferase RsmD [Clostridia bacterium]|nr:16S rRNA (guanine(966)-N(2))-methyltransferase RsmD [Clostridia bacterium]
MRVITGSARNKRLCTLPGNDVRPTTEKVKEAVFSAIQFELENSKVLDLFAGCGQMGIEALSRGADSAVFCDNSKASVDVINQNLQTCSLSDKARVVRSDYTTFLATSKEKFDICFLDPPYYAGYYENVMSMLDGVMKDGGKVLCEHPDSVILKDNYGSLKRVKDYRFSKIIVSKYVSGGNDDEK